MSKAAMITARSSSASVAMAGRIQGVAGLCGGLGVAFAVLLSLAPEERSADPAPSAEIEDLRAVPLPPPPPASSRGGVREQRPPPEIEVEQSSAPSPGAIRIAAAPPVPTTRPAAMMQFDFSPVAFRPSNELGNGDPRTIYKQSEVDQRVVVLHQKAPSIPMWLLREVSDPRVTVLMVVNADGTAENLHLLKSAHPEFDALVLEAVAQWKFRPARKNGKNVRQWLQLPVYVKAPSADRFSTH